MFWATQCSAGIADVAAWSEEAFAVLVELFLIPAELLDEGIVR